MNAPVVIGFVALAAITVLVSADPDTRPDGGSELSDPASKPREETNQSNRPTNRKDQP